MADKLSPSQAAFLAAYEHHTEGFEIHSIGRRTCDKHEGVCDCTEECVESPTEEKHVNIHTHSEACYSSEAYFSWSACDTCGSSLGGDRVPCTLTNAGLVREKDGRVHPHPIVEVESCTDCVMFAANGELPDGWQG